jgi:nucleoside-diphosphate-sugar epimerase
MINSAVSILGCGWLGRALGQLLISHGYKVFGSTRTKESLQRLNELGIQGIKLDLKPELTGQELDHFFQCNTLVLSLPPKILEDNTAFYDAQIQSILEALSHSTVKQVLFISSTSVYPALDRTIYETDAINPTSPSGKALLQAEHTLNNCQVFQTTVVRFGGLVGYERHPVRLLNRGFKRDVHQPLNIIHRDDAIEIMYQIIQKNIWGETFNACAPLHPLRWQYYTKAFKLNHQPIPAFHSRSENQAIKVISSEKIMTMLNYRFIYPDPLRMLEITEAWEKRPKAGSDHQNTQHRGKYA